MLDLSLSNWEFIDSLANAEYASHIRGLYAEQLAFENDQSQMRALIGPRRSGKTTSVIRTFLINGIPGEVHPLIAPTKTKAKQLIWPALEELRDEGKDVKLDSHNMQATLPSGAIVRLFGASCDADIDLLRGNPYPLAVIEEAGVIHDERLKKLVEEILGPSSMDFYGAGGRGIVMVGTPSLMWDGYWHGVCEKNLGDTSVHRLDVLKNPRFPPGKAAEYLEMVKRRHNWTDDSPAFIREYRGLFCIDTEGLCYPGYNRELLPAEFCPAEAVAHMGIDFGLVDPNAWVVIRALGNQASVVHAEAKAGMTHHEIAAKTRELVARFRVATIWGDSYGTGAQTIHTLRSSFALPIRPSKYPGKVVDRIHFVDSMFRSRTLHVLVGAEPLTEELNTVPWNADRTGHHESYNNHCLSALHCAISSVFQAHAPPEHSDRDEDKERQRREMLQIMRMG